MSIPMPSMLYGTAWKKSRTTELVTTAVLNGFKGIDTACQPKHYNETQVGEALYILKQRGIKRESLFLQTKFTPVEGQDPNTVPYDKEASLSLQVAQSFQKSKENLKTDYLDAYLLHSPLFPFSHLLEVWRAMERVYHNHETLALGISNCYDLAVLKRLYNEADIKPTIVQNRFYSDTDYDKEIRVWCKSHQIRYQSFWSLTANPHLLGSKTFFTLARKYKTSEAAILYAYLISQGITPLNGTTSPEHMHDDLQAVMMTLEENEQASITQLLQ